ncbi:MAG: CHAT domain-containing tetratricopeptide repeat protein, partial [Planctomycetota bacterium]
TARGNLAMTMSVLGDLPGARALQEQVLEVLSRTLPEDHPDLQTARLNLAGTMADLGDLPGARALFEQVLEFLSRTLPEDHPLLQTARGNLALTMADLGDLPGARALREQVLEFLSRTLPEDHPHLQTARSNLARSRAASGEAEKSQELARDLARTMSVRGRSLDSISDKRLVSDAVVSTALSISSGAGAFAADAVGERLCFSMCEAIRGAEASAARVRSSLRADPVARELRLGIAQANRRLNELAGSPAEDRSRFAGLVRERDRLRRALLARLEATGGGRYLPELEASAIAARLADGEVAIAYWRYGRWTIDPKTKLETTTPSYLAWVLLPDGSLRRVELGPAAEIEAAIESWRSAVGATSRRGSTSAVDLTRRVGLAVTRLIFHPLSEGIGEADKLVIAPASALHALPFDALPDGEGLLGDRYRISYRLALSDLTIEGSSPLAARSLLVVGGVDYDRPAENARTTDRERVETRSVGTAAFSLRGSRAEAFSWSFGELNETRREALAVAEYFRDAFKNDGSPEPDVLTREGATREAFEALAPQHRYLHLATHGWFAPESVASTADGIDEQMHVMGSSLRDQVRGLAPSLLCGLAFTGANGAADMYGRVRGVMTAEEIGAMDLSGVGLCVLSACETNVGLRRGGQGIASLQAALHAAGVRTAITSLWKVPDEATRELMTELYRRLWVLKEPTAKALWNAKQKIREQLDEEGSSIYSIRDWAGWVLSGDPD